MQEAARGRVVLARQPVISNEAGCSAVKDGYELRLRRRREACTWHPDAARAGEKISRVGKFREPFASLAR